MLILVQDRQLQSHAGMLESFKVDLSYLQQNPPEAKKARTKELEEHRARAEYLQYEVGEVSCVKVCVCVSVKRQISDSVSKPCR